MPMFVLCGVCVMRLQQSGSGTSITSKRSGLFWFRAMTVFLTVLFHYISSSHSSMVKKWQTLIEANVDVKTTDGYLLRLFCIGFTAKDPMSQRKTCYAQTSQVRSIRRKMSDIIAHNVNTVDLKGVVNKLVPDSISKDIEKACQGIYPLHDVYIRKVKVLKRPRFDLSKLLELHGDGSSKGAVEGGVVSAEGVVVERAEGYEPPVQESV